MISLAALIAHLPASTQVVGDSTREIAGIEIDSRAVRKGALFVALRGQHGDGHAYIPQAINLGAVALLVEEAQFLTPPPGVTVVHVPDTRAALSPLAAAFYGEPSHALDVIGVTGTNGKTTTTRMISAILDGSGIPCGVIGTVGAELGDRNWTLANTTPQPPELHAAARVDARSRGEGRRDGSEFARARTRPRRGRALSHRRADESHARPSRLPRFAGSVRSGEATAVSDGGERRAERRRPAWEAMARRRRQARTAADVRDARRRRRRSERRRHDRRWKHLYRRCDGFSRAAARTLQRRERASGDLHGAAARRRRRADRFGSR